MSRASDAGCDNDANQAALQPCGQFGWRRFESESLPEPGIYWFTLVTADQDFVTEPETGTADWFPNGSLLQSVHLARFDFSQHGYWQLEGMRHEDRYLSDFEPSRETSISHYMPVREPAAPPAAARLCPVTPQAD